MLLGLGGWVVGVSNSLGPDAVAPVTASKEARLGHRISECIVAGRVWGLGGGCFKLIWFGCSCASDCVEERLVLGIASRRASLLVGFGGWVFQTYLVRAHLRQ